MTGMVDGWFTREPRIQRMQFATPAANPRKNTGKLGSEQLLQAQLSGRYRGGGGVRGRRATLGFGSAAGSKGPLGGGGDRYLDAGLRPEESPR
jgi:hypothetical protein